MRKIALLIIIMLAVQAVPAKAEETVWKLGDRIVPGPLPPKIGEKVSVESKIDLVYGKAGDEKLKFDFAKPTVCRSQKVPLAIYIHGGAWTTGDKAEGVSSGIKSAEANLFYQLGFAVAAINYRLCPKYIFPAQIEDCKLAVRYFGQTLTNSASIQTKSASGADRQAGIWWLCLEPATKAQGWMARGLRTSQAGFRLWLIILAQPTSRN